MWTHGRPTLLNLSQWLPRDVRVLIYAQLTHEEIAQAGLAHGILIYPQEALNACTDVVTFDKIMHLASAESKLNFRPVMENAVASNNVELANYIHSWSGTVPTLGMISQAPTLEMIKWIAPLAPSGSIDSIPITSAMALTLTRWHHQCYMSSMGMGYTIEELRVIVPALAAIGTNTEQIMHGCVEAARWDVCVELQEWIGELSHDAIVQNAPDALLHVVQPYNSIHRDAWMHSPARAEWALLHWPVHHMTPIDHAHAIWLREHNCILDLSHSHMQPWMLDFNYAHVDMWNMQAFTCEHYPKMESLMPLPTEIRCTTLPEIQWLYARGVPIGSKYLTHDNLSHDVYAWVLENTTQDLKFNITTQELRTVILLAEYGWKPFDDKTLHTVRRVDTFLWMLNKYGAEPSIWMLINRMSPKVYDAVYSVQPSIPPSVHHLVIENKIAKAWLEKKRGTIDFFVLYIFKTMNVVQPLPYGIHNTNLVWDERRFHHEYLNKWQGLSRDMVPRAQADDILNLAKWGLYRDVRGLIYHKLTDLDIRMCQVARSGKYTADGTFAHAAAATSLRLYLALLRNGHTYHRDHFEIAMAWDREDVVRWITSNQDVTGSWFVTSSIACLRLGTAAGAISGTSTVEKIIHYSPDDIPCLHEFPALINADRFPYQLAANASLTTAIKHPQSWNLTHTRTALINGNTVLCAILPMEATSADYACSHSVKAIEAVMARGFQPTSTAMWYAIHAPTCECIEWLIAHGHEVTTEHIQYMVRMNFKGWKMFAHAIVWDEDAVYAAITHKNDLERTWLDSLKSCPQRYMYRLIREHCYVALQWLYDRGWLRPCDVRPAACVRAGLEMLNWMQARGLFRYRKTKRLMFAQLECNRDVSNWLGEHYTHPWAQWAARNNVSSHDIDPRHHAAYHRIVARKGTRR
jgi:hypothetical protein